MSSDFISINLLWSGDLFIDNRVFCLLSCSSVWYFCNLFLEPRYHNEDAKGQGWTGFTAQHNFYFLNYVGCFIKILAFWSWIWIQNLPIVYHFWEIFNFFRFIFSSYMLVHPPDAYHNHQKHFKKQNFDKTFCVSLINHVHPSSSKWTVTFSCWTEFMWRI